MSHFFFQNFLFKMDEVTYQVAQVGLLLAKYRKWNDCSLFVEDFEEYKWSKNTVHMTLMSVKLEMVMQIRQNNQRNWSAMSLICFLANKKSCCNFFFIKVSLVSGCLTELGP